jgi:hypothetical protein
VGPWDSTNGGTGMRQGTVQICNVVLAMCSVVLAMCSVVLAMVRVRRSYLTIGGLLRPLVRGSK